MLCSKLVFFTSLVFIVIGYFPTFSNSQLQIPDVVDPPLVISDIWSNDITLRSLPPQRSVTVMSQSRWLRWSSSGCRLPNSIHLEATLDTPQGFNQRKNHLFDRSGIRCNSVNLTITLQQDSLYQVSPGGDVISIKLLDAVAVGGKLRFNDTLSFDIHESPLIASSVPQPVIKTGYYVGAVATVAGGFFGHVPLTTVIPRANFLVSLSECSFSRTLQVDYLQYWLRYSVGTSPYKSYIGAALFNLIMFLFILIIDVSFTVWKGKFVASEQKKRERARDEKNEEELEMRQGEEVMKKLPMLEVPLLDSPFQDSEIDQRSGSRNRRRPMGEEEEEDEHSHHIVPVEQNKDNGENTKNEKNEQEQGLSYKVGFMFGKMKSACSSIQKMFNCRKQSADESDKTKDTKKEGKGEENQKKDSVVVQALRSGNSPAPYIFLLVLFSQVAPRSIIVVIWQSDVLKDRIFTGLLLIPWLVSSGFLCYVVTWLFPMYWNPEYDCQKSGWHRFLFGVGYWSVDPPPSPPPEPENPAVPTVAADDEKKTVKERSENKEEMEEKTQKKSDDEDEPPKKKKKISSKKSPSSSSDDDDDDSTDSSTDDSPSDAEEEAKKKKKKKVAKKNETSSSSSSSDEKNSLVSKKRKKEKIPLVSAAKKAEIASQRQRLKRFYKFYEPSGVENIENAMEKFSDDFTKMWAILETKYGLESDIPLNPATVSSSSSEDEIVEDKPTKKRAGAPKKKSEDGDIDNSSDDNERERGDSVLSSQKYKKADEDNEKQRRSSVVSSSNLPSSRMESAVVSPTPAGLLEKTGPVKSPFSLPFSRSASPNSFDAFFGNFSFRRRRGGGGVADSGAENNIPPGPPPKGLSNPEHYLRHFGPLFMHFREGRYWYMIMELITSIAYGTLESVRTTRGCLPVAVGAVGVGVFYFLFMVLFQPYCAPIHKIFFMYGAFVMLFAPILLTVFHVGTLSNVEWTETLATSLVVIWEYLAIAVAGFVIYGRYLARQKQMIEKYEKKEKLAAVEKEKEKRRREVEEGEDQQEKQQLKMVGGSNEEQNSNTAIIRTSAILQSSLDLESELTALTSEILGPKHDQQFAVSSNPLLMSAPLNNQKENLEKMKKENEEAMDLKVVLKRSSHGVPSPVDLRSFRRYAQVDPLQHHFQKRMKEMKDGKKKQKMREAEEMKKKKKQNELDKKKLGAMGGTTTTTTTKDEVGDSGPRSNPLKTGGFRRWKEELNWQGKYQKVRDKASTVILGQKLKESGFVEHGVRKDVDSSSSSSSRSCSCSSCSCSGSSCSSSNPDDHSSDASWSSSCSECQKFKDL